MTKLSLKQHLFYNVMLVSVAFLFLNERAEKHDRELDLGDTHELIRAISGQSTKTFLTDKNNTMFTHVPSAALSYLMIDHVPFKKYAETHEGFSAQKAVESFSVPYNPLQEALVVETIEDKAKQKFEYFKQAAINKKKEESFFVKVRSLFDL